MSFKPSPTGEWDDYCLVTVSIINEHNFSITQNDIEKAKEIFPEWTQSIERYGLSGYKTKAGGEMSWYFPTYSIACVPMTLILLFLKLHAIYAFCLTNVIVFMIMLLLIYYNNSITDKKKLILILVLSINPIVFYFSWISAETFIFSILSMSILFWVTKRYKLSAFLLSIASTLNPTILFVGIIMITEYILKIYIRCDSKNLKERFESLISKWLDIVQYGCCYIIALIPFVYNYYNIGHINLTASKSGFTISEVKPISRFIAYLLDLNFGFLPYYNFIFILAIVLFIMALIRKKYKYIIMMISFIGTIYMYSHMTHINCGMSGIARYNAWCAVIMVFAVCVYYDEIISKKYMKLGVNILLMVTIFLSSIILYKYGPMRASNTSYVYMTPIAKYILDNCPNIYNPLPSTFNSRISHRDGGYSYETPIYYKDSENRVRKILASEKDKKTLKNTLGEEKNNILWLHKKIDNLKGKDNYISIPSKYNISIYPPYNLKSNIMSSINRNNDNPYIEEGISVNENLFSWTDGNLLKMRFSILNYSEFQNIYASFKLYRIYNDKQTVSVFINGENVYDSVISNTENLEFTFKMPSNGLVDLEIHLPDAISPYTLEQSDDIRDLALAISSATFVGFGLDKELESAKEYVRIYWQFVNETDIYKYLDKLSNPNYITIISARDEFSGALNDKILEQLKNLGFKSDLKGKYRWSYIGVINSGTVEFEDMKNDKINFSKQIDDLNVEVISAGMSSGNISSIKINNKEYSMKYRGLNIVVYDKETDCVVDSVCFDTHSDLKSYR